MSSSDTSKLKYPLTSKAWKYFDIKDRNSKIAKCKICRKVFSYRTSTTNLIKHIKYRHKNALRENSSDKSENGEGSTLSLSENEGDECNDDDSDSNQPNKALESLDPKNEEESVCLLCEETFPEQDSAEMMEHMFKVHNISQIKLVDGSIHLEQEENKPVKSKPKRSCSWDYFTVKDKAAKMAVCNLCDREFSYKSTVSNLIKHLQRKHNIAPKRGQAPYLNDSVEKQIYKPRSSLWTFFNYVNDEKTVCACVHCNKEFNIVGGLTHMKTHLFNKHPEALLHHKSNSDPLFITINENDNDGDEEDIQAEYLDFENLDEPDKGKHRPSFGLGSRFERRSSLERRPKISRKNDSYRSPVRTQNKVPVMSQTIIPESLEHFSNYITSLLLELPEKISKKLQMNFVKQIIEAQISCAEIGNSKEETVTRINSTVDGAMDKNDTSVSVDGLIAASEGITTTSANIVNGDRTVSVGNGIILRPILTTLQK